jgi:hypothetical protein
MPDFRETNRSNQSYIAGADDGDLYGSVCIKLQIHNYPFQSGLHSLVQIPFRITASKPAQCRKL